MSKKLQLTIPTPCHENWDNMTPVQQGKFCGSCHKQVVDFSSMSDRQVAEFFKKPSTGSVCGRFMTDQLDRSIEIPRKRIPWVKYFFQFVLPAFLISIKASAQKTQGKINVTTVTKGTTNPGTRTVGLVAPVCIKPPAEEIKGDIKLTKLSGVIQLKVVNGKGEPIPYASIETGVIGKGGAADKNGLFNLDKSILNINAQLFISSVGYERKAVPVKTIANINGTFLVELKTVGWLPEVVITAIQKTTQSKIPYNCPSSNNTSFQQFLNGYVSCCPIPISHEPIDISKIRDLSTPSKVNLSNSLTGIVGMISISRIETKSINGKVIDEYGNPIPNASVVIKGTRTGVVTNENGSFSITPVAGWNNITLAGSCAGFLSTESLVDKKTYSDSVILQIKTAEFIGGAVVVCRKPITKKEIKNVPLIPDIVDDKLTAVFKVFPNPIESGSSLNIEIKKVEEGYYSLQLLNQSGQSVHQEDIWIDADARLLNIDIPGVSAGTYFLALTNRKSGKRSTEKIIIQ